MKISHIAAISCAALALIVPASRAASDIFPLNVAIQGSIQTGVGTNALLNRVQVNTADLLHFGLGVPLTNPISKSAVLALAADCPSNQLRIIAYDTESGANLVTIGVVEPILELTGLQRREVATELIAEINILPTGDGTNGLTGGSWFLSATVGLTTNGCLKNLKGTILGTLGTSFYASNLTVTVTNDIVEGVTNSVLVTNLFIGPQTYDVAVSRSKISTAGKRIGILVED